MPHSPESPPSVATSPRLTTVFGVLDPCAGPGHYTGTTPGGRLFAVAAAAVPEALPQLSLRRLRSGRGRRRLLARVARVVRRPAGVRFAHVCLLAPVVLAALLATLEPSVEDASTASRDARRTAAHTLKPARPSERSQSTHPHKEHRRDEGDRFDARYVSRRARTPRRPAVPAVSRAGRRPSTRVPSPPPPAPRAPALPAPVPAGAPPEFP
jgi:hypothetical protein